jgi:hypothetical protein
MTVRRYTEIRSKAVRDGDDQPRKTKPKHYCPDWDMLLIYPGDPEMAACSCEFDGDYVRWLR